jgi:peptide/nickel transport system substrate-binding protein
MLPEYLEQLPSYKTANSIEFYFLRFNTIRGIMQNKLIRQAVNYAIDKEAIVEALFLGSAIPARGQLAKEAYFGFNKNLDAYAFNPEKAKELLKEAGYKGEVVQLISERGRWMKDGEISEAVASMISDVGINVKLTFLSWQQWLDTLFNLEKAPDIMFSSNGNELFDMDRFYQAIIKTGGPQSAYSNPDIDKKIDAARNEMDPVKRQAMYEELAQLVYDDPFGVPLINLKSIWGISKDLEWEPREDGRMLISEMSLK